MKETGGFEGRVKTSLFAVHEQYGARMVDFAGWAMPLEYEGTLAEHRAVRQDVGVFDVSHLGRVWITGEGAEQALSATFTNDPSQLTDGRSHYTLLCTETAGIVDDLIVYRFSADRFLAVPNASNTAAVVAALNASAAEAGARVEDATGKLAMIAVQGPRAPEIVHDLFPDAGGVAFRNVAEVAGGPTDAAWVCRTGYTGEVGYELIVPQRDAPGVFRTIVDEYDAAPAGLGARDTLRLEMGYPLHGQDLTTDTDPIEARLEWAVDLDRDTYPGARVLRQRAEAGPRRRLWGLRQIDRGIPRAGMSVHRDGHDVGTVTSGTFSPTLREGIGLAYLATGTGPGDEHGAEPGDRVSVDVRGTAIGFEVVQPPFVDADPRGT